MKDTNTVPIIICGTGRSGTSIFTQLLNLHRNLWAFRWETQIFSGLPNLCEIVARSFNPNAINKFKERLFTHLFRRTVRPGTDREYQAGLFEMISYEDLEKRFQTMLAQIDTATSRPKRIAALRQFAFNIFEKATNDAGASRWCEKTPRNLVYAEQILEILGDCRFINIIRDGRDVISSILERKFWPIARYKGHPLTSGLGGSFTAKNAAIYWRNLMQLTSEKKAAIGPERWLDVRLEDLSQEPKKVWEQILDFLDEEWDEAVLDLDSTILKRKPKGKLNWQDGAHVGRWAQDLSIDEIVIVEKIISEELHSWDYRTSS